MDKFIRNSSTFLLTSAVILVSASLACPADPLPVIAVEGQPLAANARRLLAALELLGAPLTDPEDLQAAITARDAAQIQRLLDSQVLLIVQINPESRVKVTRGPSAAKLQQHGFRPAIVKVVNEATVTAPLTITSPQSGPVYGGEMPHSLKRQGQLNLVSDGRPAAGERFLQVEMFHSPPMASNLSGLGVEYAIALIYSSESGKREATIGFDVGQGTQDLGFRAEAPVLFDVLPAARVKLTVKDVDGSPTTARLTFRDAARNVYPPQAKRVAPDFFFQEQIYRRDGDTVLLPPGPLTVEYSRGPEYRQIERKIVIADSIESELMFHLERWVEPRQYGFYSGDHHIHAAGCAHYTHPTEGVSARDMFLQVQGEGLNVGCVLTWGPCYDYQRQFFSPAVDKLSEPLTLMKYDVEVSGFGSQSLGHVCLLNLADQTYPGSDGTTKNWPTWTTPVMRWAKKQGGIVGYAHSASGLHIDAASSAKRQLAALDTNRDGRLSSTEAAAGLLTEPFATIDANRDRVLTESELVATHERVADMLPNLAVPEMNGVGAMEIGVTTALGVCDFISAMDTARIPEWNTWYHLLNCGFPLKVSGETDFPCMSSTRVGQGRVYVQLGKVESLDFRAWCQGLAAGRSYVSDGYAHALQFSVEEKPAGEQLTLAAPRNITVKALVAFGKETPLGVPYGGVSPDRGKRLSGDTVTVYEPRSEGADARPRRVELVVNGRAVAVQEVPADNEPHEVRFTVPINRSSWVALRQFPQLHTNPVNVIIGGRPIRVSQSSARWCIATIEQLWRARSRIISEAERDEAHKTFQQAIELYRRIAAEAPAGT